MQNFMHEYVSVTSIGTVFKLKQFFCTSIQIHESVCILTWNEKVCMTGERHSVLKNDTSSWGKLIYYLHGKALKASSDVRGPIGLFISKIVDISFSDLYMFYSKRCFLPQPEFLDKVQDPFGEVLL